MRLTPGVAALLGVYFSRTSPHIKAISFELGVVKWNSQCLLEGAVIGLRIEQERWIRQTVFRGVLLLQESARQ